jgi:hypothetical protein
MRAVFPQQVVNEGLPYAPYFGQESHIRIKNSPNLACNIFIKYVSRKDHLHKEYAIMTGEPQMSEPGVGDCHFLLVGNLYLRNVERFNQPRLD